jgi:hypothetical protein
MSTHGPGEQPDVPSMKPGQALAVVEARLGRPPRDGLEAAVVLEAWGGLRTDAALQLGERVMGEVSDTRAEAPQEPRLQPPEPISYLVEICGLVGFVSMATWAVPLGKALTNVDIDLAFKVGVPLALAVQWMVRRRYFSGERRLGSFGSDGVRFTLLLLLGYCGIAATGDTGVLIAVLEVIWFSGYILAKDGKAMIFVVGLGATTWSLYAEVRPELVLPVVATLLVACALFCGVRHTRSRRRQPQRNPPVLWREVFPSMIIGAALGVMMVFSVAHLRPAGWMLAAALLPAGAGALVAAGIMRTLWFRLDTVLATAPAWSVGGAGSRAMSRRVALAATGYFVTAIALSAIVTQVLVAFDQELMPVLELETGFVLFCWLAMMADFQHSWNRIRWAFVIAVVACVVDMAMRFTLADASAGLTIGASCGIVISVFAQRTFMRRPAQILATAVSIP